MCKADGRPFFFFPQLLPFTEESGDPIETRLRKRQMESVDFSPFVNLGVSNFGEQSSIFGPSRDRVECKLS